MKKLDVESSEGYLEAESMIQYLIVLKEYYERDANFNELEMGEIKLRELFRFMSDHGFPKKGFVTQEKREGYVKSIQEEIVKTKNDLKKARLSEMKDKELNSILIIPSWSEVIGYKTKGFYLNRPVIELKRDTIVMLSLDTVEVKDKFGNSFALLKGPGLFFTEFSLDKGFYVTNTRDINMLLLPLDILEKLLTAPPIFQSDIDATINELISIIPFSLIEEVASVQTLLRGIISRNVFHPNKVALDTFLEILETPESFSANDGFKIMSAHEEYFNRILLSNPPPKAKGDESFNITSAGIQSILVNSTLINEFIPDKNEQNQLLLQFRDLKK